MLFHPDQLGFVLSSTSTENNEVWEKQIYTYQFHIQRIELYKERKVEEREHQHWLIVNNNGDYRYLNLICREAALKDVVYWKQGYMMPRGTFIGHDKGELAAHDTFVAYALSYYRNQKLDKLL